MMSNKFVGTLLLSAIAITASTDALAEKPENLWGLGFGAVISDQGYIGVSNEVTPVEWFIRQCLCFCLVILVDMLRLCQGVSQGSSTKYWTMNESLIQ
jgi:hypothetical protein